MAAHREHLSCYSRPEKSIFAGRVAEPFQMRHAVAVSPPVSDAVAHEVVFWSVILVYIRQGG